MLLLGLDGLLKDEIGLRKNGVIIFGVMSVVLRGSTGTVKWVLGMKAKWLD